MRNPVYAISYANYNVRCKSAFPSMQSDQRLLYRLPRQYIISSSLTKILKYFHDSVGEQAGLYLTWTTKDRFSQVKTDMAL